MGDSNEKANKKVRNEKLFQREKKKEGEESGRRVKREERRSRLIYIFFSLPRFFVRKFQKTRREMR